MQDSTKAMLLRELEYSGAQLHREKRAREIITPLAKQVREAYHVAARLGKRPTIICLGQRQMDVFEARAEAMQEIDFPTHIRGMRIVWTGDLDAITVYEERKGGWF